MPIQVVTADMGRGSIQCPAGGWNGELIGVSPATFFLSGEPGGPLDVVLPDLGSCSGRGSSPRAFRVEGLVTATSLEPLNAQDVILGR